MTTDDTPFPATGYLQISVPGVPYSAIRVPIVNDLERDNLWVEHAMLIATLTAKVYAEAFPVTAAPAQESRQQGAPPPPPQTPQNHRPATVGALDPALVVRGECPHHEGVQVLPSKLMYQETEVDELGTQRYAKYFCPGKENGTGANHQVWAREIIQR